MTYAAVAQIAETWGLLYLVGSLRRGLGLRLLAA